MIGNKKADKFKLDDYLSKEWMSAKIIICSLSGSSPSASHTINNTRFQPILLNNKICADYSVHHKQTFFNKLYPVDYQLKCCIPTENPKNNITGRSSCPRPSEKSASNNCTFNP
ncbi:MAG: hypothetical protein Q7J11_00025 [Candidatus Roizmanbacteria bacterium]|nr:hypothetical protein [Candidatus Roizmanbacteria bacterium]